MFSSIYTYSLPLPVDAFNQNSASSYLKNNQVDDWTVMALASGKNLEGVNTNFLNQDPGNNPTDIEKRILARSAAGYDDGGMANRLADQFDGTEIAPEQKLINDDIFGLLALSAANKKPQIRSKLAEFIIDNQNSDGGWGFVHSPSQSDSNDTAMAIMALIAGGEDKNSNTIKQAFKFLNSTKKNGGYAFASGYNPDTASTAWVVSAFSAVGQNPPNSAINFLKDKQQTNGGFSWQENQNPSALMTAYAVIALNEDFYPIQGKGSVPEPPQTGTVGGQVVNENGQPVSGAKIDTCSLGTQITDNNGHWKTEYQGKRQGLCARIISLPNKYISAKPSNLTAETAGASTYEHQIAGTYSRESGIGSEENVKWDIADDLGLNFIAKEKPENPEPVEQDFQVAVVNGEQIYYKGNQSFNSFTFADSSGASHNFSSPRALGTLIESGLSYEINNTSLGFFVKEINQTKPQGTIGWQYAVNGTKPNVGAADYKLSNGDQVLWFFADANSPTPQFPNDDGQIVNDEYNTRLQINVNVVKKQVQPEIILKASKENIKIGDETTLSWEIKNANIANSSPNNWTNDSMKGSLTIQPAKTTEFTITAVSGTETKSKTIKISVNQQPSIVFGVDQASINFGNLTPGESSDLKTIKITNSGTKNLEIKAQLEKNTPLFKTGLSVDGQSINNFQSSLQKQSGKNLQLKLTIPNNFSQNGEILDVLIFKAKAK